MKHNEDNVFDAYRKKLAREGVLKAFLIALTAASVIAFVIALCTWFAGVNGLWFALGGFALMLAVLTPVLYYAKYRPHDEVVAARIDACGLEERMITYHEYKNDDSFIATKQRADALGALDAVSGNIRLLAISVPLVVAAAVSCLAGAGMTAANALSAYDAIPSFEWIKDEANDVPHETFYSVRYLTADIDVDAESENIELKRDEAGNIAESLLGFVDGDDEQLVVSGGDCTPVYAEEEEDGLFLGWCYFENDALTLESREPFRMDAGVVGDNAVIIDGEDYPVITYYAVFLPSDGEGDGDGDGDSQEQDPDQPQDEPDESDENPDDQDPDNDNQDPDNNKGDADKPQNGIIDGETDYHELYDYYYNQAQEIIAQGGELPPELIKIIEMYYEIIK